MRDTTFNKIAEEFSLAIAIKVVQYGTILKTTKPKLGDFDTPDAFSTRCKKRFTKKIAWTTDDVDLIADICMASVDYETKEDMAGLGGCVKAKTISELL